MGGSETSKHFGCSVLLNVFLVFFGLLCYCWLSDQSNEQDFYLNRFVKSAAPQPAQASSFSISPLPWAYRQRAPRSIRGGLNQRKPTTTSENNQNTQLFKGFRRTLGYGFGLVWFVGFPYVFVFVFKQKNLRENQKQTRPNPYPRVRLKPLNTLVCWFSRRFVWLSVVFLCICGFPDGLFCCLKPFGKVNKPNKTKPISYPRVGLKPLNTLVVRFY